MPSITVTSNSQYRPGITWKPVIPGEIKSMLQAILTFCSLDTHTQGVAHHFSTILIASMSGFLNINLGLWKMKIFLIKVCDFQA